jgi:hypothetical protein
MLRAYVDESSPADGHGRFVIAGYVSFCHEWEDFTDLWASTLAAAPAVPYFRMASFRDKKWREEHGITKEEADAKTEALASLIREPYFLFSCACSISHDEFREIITPQARRFRLGRLTWLKTPYNMVFQRLVRIVLWKIIKLGIVGDQVDFVFDDNDALFDDANKLRRELRTTLNEPYRSLLGEVIPGDNEKLKPLQVADLLAARLKDHCVDPKNIALETLLREITGKGDKNATRHLSRSEVEAFAAELATKPGYKHRNADEWKFESGG